MPNPGPTGSPAGIDASAAATFVENFVQTMKLPATLVVDVGTLAGGRWAVIETNATWGSGLNGCDARNVCKCLVDAVQHRKS